MIDFPDDQSRPASAAQDGHETRVRRQYGLYGGILGTILGLLAGILVSGPRFHVWPVATTLKVLAACTVGGGLLGFLASRLANGASEGPVGNSEPKKTGGDQECEDPEEIAEAGDAPCGDN